VPQPAATTTEATAPAVSAVTAAQPAPEPATTDLETFLRFTVDDLWYADTDLDRAMDLLAICDVPLAAPERVLSDGVAESPTQIPA
jgi:hypothetical protein